MALAVSPLRLALVPFTLAFVSLALLTVRTGGLGRISRLYGIDRQVGLFVLAAAYAGIAVPFLFGDPPRWFPAVWGSYLVGVIFVGLGLGTLRSYWPLFLVPRYVWAGQLSGRTVVSGTGRPVGTPAERPFSGEPCLYCHWRVERRQVTAEDDHDVRGHRWHSARMEELQEELPATGWEPIALGETSPAFVLEDADGRAVTVEPDAATLLGCEEATSVHPGDDPPAADSAIATGLERHAGDDYRTERFLRGLEPNYEWRFVERSVAVDGDVTVVGHPGGDDRVAATAVSASRLPELRRAVRDRLFRHLGRGVGIAVSSGVVALASSGLLPF